MFIDALASSVQDGVVVGAAHGESCNVMSSGVENGAILGGS